MLELFIEAQENDESLIGRVVEKNNKLQPVRCGTKIISKSGIQVVYTKLDYDKELYQKISKIKFKTSNRMASIDGKWENGTISDFTFGFKPSRPVFGHVAGQCIFNKNNPEIYSLLVKTGVQIKSIYEQLAPEQYRYQNTLSQEKIKKDYKIPGTIFTQGVVNNNNSLNYHYDRGNFKNCLSAMLWMIKDVNGGELNIPSLGVRLIPEDGGIVLFDGQAHIHGVTPIYKKNNNSNRFSVVYYAIKAMENLGTYEEELRKQNIMQTKKALK